MVVVGVNLVAQVDANSMRSFPGEATTSLIGRLPSSDIVRVRNFGTSWGGRSVPDLPLRCTPTAVFLLLVRSIRSSRMWIGPAQHYFAEKKTQALLCIPNPNLLPPPPYKLSSPSARPTPAIRTRGELVAWIPLLQRTF